MPAKKKTYDDYMAGIRDMMMQQISSVKEPSQFTQSNGQNTKIMRITTNDGVYIYIGERVNLNQSYIEINASAKKMPNKIIEISSQDKDAYIRAITMHIKNLERQKQEQPAIEFMDFLNQTFGRSGK